MANFRIRRRWLKLGVTAVLLLILLFGCSVASCGRIGLNKKNVYIREIPRSTVSYAAISSPLSMVSKFTSSVYARSIAADKTINMEIDRTRSLLQALKTLPFFQRLFVSYALNRDAALLMTDTPGAALEDSGIYLLLDIGRLPGVVLSVTGTPVSRIAFMGKRFSVARGIHNGIRVETWRDDSTSEYAVAYTRGRAIITFRENTLKKLLDFYTSRRESMLDEHFLNDAHADKKCSAQFYIDTVRCSTQPIVTNNALLRTLRRTLPSDAVYGTVHVGEDTTDTTLELNYKGDGAASLKEMFGRSRAKTGAYFYPKSTMMLFDVGVRDWRGFYAACRGYFQSLSNAALFSDLAASMSMLDERFDFSNLITEVASEAGVGVLRNNDAYHYLFMFSLRDEAHAIPALEAALTKKYTVRKREIRFKDKFIYYYDYGASEKLYFCMYKDKFFFARDLDAIKDLIAELPQNGLLASRSPYVKTMSDEASHAILYLNMAKAYDFLPGQYSAVERSLYPRIVYIKMTAASDTVMLNGRFRIDFSAAR
ncbi:MAG: hypothetical protein HZC28_12500 [Spirochaetes bacterium]|nr:hypothetical protein [Spirochaetota bacterium]